MSEKTIMPLGIQAMVTILGGLFAILSCMLIYQLFTNEFSWGLLFGLLVTTCIAFDFLIGAFSRDYPFIILLWFTPTYFDEN